MAVVSCLFEWDENYKALLRAKHQQLTQAAEPTEAAARKAVTREEVARHCRRRTLECGGRRGYQSRWKIILDECSKVRSRLFNSSTLMDETNLALFSVNETTLRQWYDKVHTYYFNYALTSTAVMFLISGTRTHLGGMKIKLLMQGVPNMQCAQQKIDLPPPTLSLQLHPPETVRFTCSLKLRIHGAKLVLGNCN